MKLVRKAALENAEAIARVHVSSWQRAYRGIIPYDFLDGLSVPERTEFWRSQLTSKTAQALVVAVENEVVGFAGFGPSRDDKKTRTAAELYAIYVTPDYWDAGCGSSLWAEAERILKTDSVTLVTLWVLSENQRGRKFYERNGFAADGTTRPISISKKAMTELRYVKSFPINSTCR